MLHIPNISIPCLAVLIQEFYLCFAYISLRKTYDPRVEPFNKLGLGLLKIIRAHIKYQGRLHVVVQINANVKIVTPWYRPF